MAIFFICLLVCPIQHITIGENTFHPASPNPYSPIANAEPRNDRSNTRPVRFRFGRTQPQHWPARRYSSNLPASRDSGSQSKGARIRGSQNRQIRIRQRTAWLPSQGPGRIERMFSRLVNIAKGKNAFLREYIPNDTTTTADASQSPGRPYAHRCPSRRTLKSIGRDASARVCRKSHPINVQSQTVRQRHCNTSQSTIVSPVAVATLVATPTTTSGCRSSYNARISHIRRIHQCDASSRQLWGRQFLIQRHNHPVKVIPTDALASRYAIGSQRRWWRRRKRQFNDECSKWS